MQFKPLTPEQAQFFEEHGYLVVPNALDPVTLARVRDAVDQIYERGLREEGLNRAGAYERRNCIGMDDVFLDLLDWPATVPYVPQMLTWDIQLDTSHIIVRPPQPPGTSAAFKAIGWHRDGGISTHEIPEPLPRLRLKICYPICPSQGGATHASFPAATCWWASRRVRRVPSIQPGRSRSPAGPATPCCSKIGYFTP
jgi:ectoine hydroxylase-related dioxygenase (phytanoyl-CoA dioxygenase family)